MSVGRLIEKSLPDHRGWGVGNLKFLTLDVGLGTAARLGANDGEFTSSRLPLKLHHLSENLIKGQLISLPCLGVSCWTNLDCQANAGVG
jgi:hypothetical protein